MMKWLRRKASAAGVTLVQAPGVAQWSARNYGAFAKEAYTMNVVAYQAINRVADAVAGSRWDVWRGGERVEGTQLETVWARPNPLQSGPEFIRAAVGYLLISGNSYMERVQAGRRVELWTLRPDRMQVVPGADGLPAAYQYKHNGRQIRWANDPITGGDVRHVKMFNPIDDFYGLSPIEAAAFGVDQHNEAMQWMQALLQNAARPSGALKITQPVGQEQLNRLKAEMETAYSGSGNAGRPLILEGGMEWESMGMSPQSMDLLNTKFSSARDVCLAFGVPPQLLGIPGDSTYSNYKEARLAFYEDTVLPFIDLFTDEVNDWLSPLFGGLNLKPNMDTVPAIADKRASLWDMADKSTDLTVNERRALKGYDPLPDGDVREEVRRGTDAVKALHELTYG